MALGGTSLLSSLLPPPLLPHLCLTPRASFGLVRFLVGNRFLPFLFQMGREFLEMWVANKQYKPLAYKGVAKNW